MNDLDRWVDLEGPPPPGMRELLDVLVPPVSPEHEAELDRRIYAAIAADRRREEQTRHVWRVAAAVAAVAILVAGMGGGVLMALRGDTPGGRRATAVANVRAAEPARARAAPDGGAPR